MNYCKDCGCLIAPGIDYCGECVSKHTERLVDSPETPQNAEQPEVQE